MKPNAMALLLSIILYRCELDAAILSDSHITRGQDCPAGVPNIPEGHSARPIPEQLQTGRYKSNLEIP